MKNRLYVLGALLVMMVGFQNCGNAGFAEGEIASVSESSLRSLDLQGNDQIQVMSDSSTSPSPSRYVALRSIQFARDVDYVVGVFDGAMASEGLAPEQIARPAFEFLLKLDLRSGKIYSTQTGEPVSALTNSERTELNSVLSGSMIARMLDIPLPPNAGNYYCPQEYQEAYALLQTTAEYFELGSGKSVCHAKDLLKIGQGIQKSGLSEFLQKLTARVSGL